MKKIIIIIVLLLLTCNFVNAKTYNVDKNTTKLAIKKGDKIVLQLNENPTTGYMWKISNSNSSVINEKSKKYFSPSSKLLGAPGYTKWNFKAINIGNDKLQGFYYRPWEKQPAKPTYELNITVE